MSDQTCDRCGWTGQHSPGCAIGQHQAILESSPYKLLLAGMESQADLNDGLKQENRELRNALGVSEDERVVSAEHGSVLVDGKGGDRKRISPASEREMTLEQENREQAKEIERLRAVVHDCPKCGESCRECLCWRNEQHELLDYIRELKAENERLTQLTERLMEDVPFGGRGLVEKYSRLIDTAEARIAAALAISDTGSEEHKEAFASHYSWWRNTTPVPEVPGWRMAEKMREVLLGS